MENFELINTAAKSVVDARNLNREEGETSLTALAWAMIEDGVPVRETLIDFANAIISEVKK